jgi:hypothetical protein
MPALRAVELSLVEGGAKAMAEVAIKAQIAAVKEVMVNYNRLLRKMTIACFAVQNN